MNVLSLVLSLGSFLLDLIRDEINTLFFIFESLPVAFEREKKNLMHLKIFKIFENNLNSQNYMGGGPGGGGRYALIVL